MNPPSNEHAVEFLQSIVAIPSLSGREREVSEHIVAELPGLGFSHAYGDEVGNAVGIVDRHGLGDAAQQTIVLLGHIDTVPGDIPVRIEQGRLYGRGSVDAKGSFATAVIAAARAQIKPGVRLVVIGAVEEESASSRGARHAASCFSPAACLIGEPSGWNGITLGYKGRMLVDYRHCQDESHSAGPETTPADQAFRWWQGVLEHASSFNRDRPRLFDQLLPTLRRIQTSSNGLQSELELRAGFRLPPAFQSREFCDFLTTSAGPATLAFSGLESAWQTPQHAPIANALARAIRHSGGRPKYKQKTGTSDMNVVGPIWRCPIVAYGPGDSSLDHTPHEHLPIDEYLQAIEVLRLALESPLA